MIQPPWMKLFGALVIVITVKLQYDVPQFVYASEFFEVGTTTDVQEGQYTCLTESKLVQNSSFSPPQLLDVNSYIEKHHCWSTGNDLACEIATQSKARSMLPFLPGSNEKHGGGFLHSCNERWVTGERATILVTMHSLSIPSRLDFYKPCFVARPSQYICTTSFKFYPFFNSVGSTLCLYIS